VRYFLDTEFSERGHEHPIELISIGIVAEDEREFYAVASDGWSEEHCNDWVKANVLPQLADPRWRRICSTGSAPRFSRTEIVEHALKFIGDFGEVGDKPEFWGYFCDYDWVVFCQLFGTMMNLPKGWPMYCNDVKQLCVALGDPRLPEQTACEHNALTDARHIRAMYKFLEFTAAQRLVSFR